MRSGFKRPKCIGVFYPDIFPSSRAQVLLAERAVRARLELVAAISYLKTHAALQVDSSNLQPDVLK
jgi:hypothetical protein